MQSNQTLNNLQNAIDNGERIDDKELLKILLNINYGFLNFIEHNPGYIITVTEAKITKDNIEFSFKEKENTLAFWEDSPTEPPKNDFKPIIVPKSELKNIKNIIAQALKQQGVEFYDDSFLKLSDYALPQQLNPIDTKYNDEEDKNLSDYHARIENWQTVKDHPDKYAKLLVNSYIEVYNLMNDESFDDKQKHTLLTKLDLMNHKFKDYIKEILDEKYPDKNEILINEIIK